MPFYDSVVPAYLQMLGESVRWTEKGRNLCCRKEDRRPAVLLGTRLFPGHAAAEPAGPALLRFRHQGQRAPVRQNEAPAVPDTETTFDELQQRIGRTVDYLKNYKPAQFDGGETREITFPTGPGKTTTMSGQQFLTSFSLPSF